MDTTQLKRIADAMEEILRLVKEDQEKTKKYLEDVYDIEWITRQDHSYKAARLLVAGGGPNIWVNLQTNTVDGYWASDKFSWSFQDNIGLDNYLEAIHGDK